MPEPQPVNELVAPKRGFDTQEFQHRCSLLQSRMQQLGIDILWLSTEADIRYFTGFLTQFWQSPTRPWYVLIPQTGKPIAIIPSIGALCMQRTWVDDIRTWSSPHPTDDGLSLLLEAIQSLAGESACIGIPMESGTWLRCPVKDWQAIQAQLPAARWVDSSSSIHALRQIKSPAEIEKLRYICQVTSNAFAQIPELLTDGMSELDAFRAFRIACLQAGADEPAYLVGAATLNGYEDIISPPSDKPLTQGDVVVLDTGCVFDGYYSDFNRNFAMGSVDDATADAHRIVWDATEAGLDFVKPGVTCAELFHVMQDVMLAGCGNNASRDSNADSDIRHRKTRDSNADSTIRHRKTRVNDSDNRGSNASTTHSDVGRLGHGLGIQLTETPSIAAHDQTVLKAGMIMTLEPGYSYAPGRLMVQEENIVVTATGYELLSRRATREIPIIDSA